MISNNTNYDLQGWVKFSAQLEIENPILSTHLESWKNISLPDYADYLWRGLRRKGADDRIDPFVSAVTASCTRRFGTEFSLAQQLVEMPVVISAHHTAPIFHPIALQTLLAAVSGRRTPQTIPVLSTDWIPMDNLFYPRGLLLPGTQDMVTVNLFGKQSRKKLVSTHAAYDELQIETTVKAVERLLAQKEISEQTAQYYCYLLDEYYRDGFVLAQEKYSHQCSVINFSLCKSLFPELDFAFINISEIAIDLLIQQLKDETSLMFKLLFYPGFRSELIQQLDGEAGCWDTKKMQGSILFWLIEDDKMQSFHYHYDDTLFAKSYQLSLQPAVVIEALRSGKIIPGMSLVFSMLMFSFGVSCLGGMRQIVYARAIQRAVAGIVERYSEEDCEHIHHFPTDAFVAGLYPQLDAAGNPRSLVDCLFESGFSKDQLRDCSLIQAALNARDVLLSLS